MAGVILVVQVLTYPTFKKIDENQFAAFHAEHSRKVTFIVLPPMALELLTAAALVYLFTDHLFFWTNLVLVLAIWIVTFFLSVPAHNHLSTKQDLKKIDFLVLSNWLRTALWSLRLVALCIYGYFF
jgi:hypothetical protein